MRRCIYLFLLFGAALSSLRAQLIEPPKWSYSLSEDSWTEGTEPTLHLRAEIETGWYMYASDFSADLGPVRAEIYLKDDPSYSKIGELRSLGRKKGYDSTFNGTYTYFTKKAHFTQSIRVEKIPLRFVGSLTYQLCSEKTGQCVLFEKSFSQDAFVAQRDVSSSQSSSEQQESISFSEDSLTEKQSSVSLSVSTEERGSLWGFFFIAFFAGLAALLTPCVFPLIPMTVTYFTSSAQQGRKRALLYGVFIVIIYTLIGFVVAPFMGPEIANELATGWIPNLIFFLIFVVFGLSFLGMFEIILPYGWANLTESKSERRGIFGVFFMALTLVIVTFSCTGPIVGSILVESVGGLRMKPVLGMLGYSLAFALPFSFFALFPKWLSALPKSGGWLNTVKVTLGFLELAFALKFLSIADQAYHWSILDREVYISLWIVIFGLLGLYLIGKLRLPKDSTLKYVSVPRLVSAMLAFSFVVYLVPGMFGAPLKALSGYLPPQSTHDFDLSLIKSGSAKDTSEEAPCGAPLYGDFLKFPHNLQGYFDYQQALACARTQNKPLFIDFTGHGCVNCREMEARVWSDPQILTRLRKDYVLVALYIDERTQLPEKKWYTSSYDNKLKKTIGKQNADLQITRFNNNAQPYYILLGQEEELLAPPRAYNLDKQGFVDFLDKGKSAYDAKYATPEAELKKEKQFEYKSLDNL